MMIFYIIFYFGRRGRENLRKMKKNTFQTQVVYQTIDEMDKNHSEKETKKAIKGRMYEVSSKQKKIFLVADNVHLS